MTLPAKASGLDTEMIAIGLRDCYGSPALANRSTLPAMPITHWHATCYVTYMSVPKENGAALATEAIRKAVSQKNDIPILRCVVSAFRTRNTRHAPAYLKRR